MTTKEHLKKSISEKKLYAISKSESVLLLGNKLIS